MWGAAKAVRTRNEHDERYEQSAYGEKFSGHTPAWMFLERYGAFATDVIPRVSAIGRRPGGELFVRENLRTKEEVLSWVISCVDGNRTAYEVDDYSARLIVLDDASRLAWLEMLHPDTDSLSHPEIDQ